MLFRIAALVAFSFVLMAGGKPSRQTPADQRLKRNNPNAGKPKPQAPAPSSSVQPTAILKPMIPVLPPAKPPTKKGK